jgi:hypothetical protein
MLDQMSHFLRASLEGELPMKEGRQNQHKPSLVAVMLTIIVVAGIVPASSQQLSQSTSNSASQLGAPSGLASPSYQADFTPVIVNGYHAVTWGNGYLVSFGLGEMKEPVTLYDKAGNWLYANSLNLDGARLVYGQDVVATKSGTAIVAASAATADGAIADMIVELGKEGIRRIIRTTPFYPLKVCVTDEGTVWAFGKELTPDRRAEPRSNYALLREYSFDTGELRTTLSRSTFHPPAGVPLTGTRGDAYLECNSKKVVLASGATNELIEYDLASSALSRWPMASLGDGFYMTGAALTRSGDVYVSTLRPGQNALTSILRIRESVSGIAEWTSLQSVPAANNFFILLGNDGDDLVYARGRRSPTVFWSSVSRTEVAK